jgi:hypothetical protein
MPITSLNDAVNGMRPPQFFAKAATPTLVAGRPQSLWGLAGAPGAGGFDTTLAGVALTNATAGAIPLVNPAGGLETRLARFLANATQPGMLILADRLWHNGGFTITATTAQTVNSATWPARDIAGTTNGDGVVLGLEISAAAGAAAPSITVSYTNQAGTSGRTGTNSFPTANSPTAGAFYPIGLQSGDSGVRSVQSLTLSASWVSGTMNLVAYRPLAAIPVGAAFVPGVGDILTLGSPRIYDSSCLFLLFVPNTTTASNVQGEVVWTQG